MQSQTEQDKDDFLAGVCPIDPDELSECTACQMNSSQEYSGLRTRRVIR